MRLVGLLMVGLGSVVLWAEIQGQNPLAHLRQLQDLFGHQHLTPSPASSLGSILGRRATSPSDRTNPAPSGSTPGVTPVAG